jgi:hypothetical protein
VTATPGTGWCNADMIRATTELPTASAVNATATARIAMLQALLQGR